MRGNFTTCQSTTAKKCVVELSPDAELGHRNAVSDNNQGQRESGCSLQHCIVLEPHMGHLTNSSQHVQERSKFGTLVLALLEGSWDS
jgi:hypothetical protein